ncbi:MAG: hypothetical protein RBU37_15760 [Myxococcota bacterium]|jgi:zinc transporter ZupT|nr:hypothetical protein [Myxococcota bacterium]
MSWLLVAIVSLLAGVVVLPLLRERHGVLAFLDGFVVLSVTSLVALHLVPHSIAGGGWLAVGATLIGLAIPLVAHAKAHPHRHQDGLPHAHQHSERLSTPVLVIGAVGLFAHELLDGTALALPVHSHDEEHSLLALAVLLHRLPFGLALGLILMPVWGFVRTLLVAIALCVATVIGFVLGGHTLPMAGLQGLAALQALIAGTLLHVVFHHTPEAHEARHKRIPAALGAMLGVGVGLWLGMHEAHAEQHAHEHGHGHALSEVVVKASLVLLLLLLLSEPSLRLRERCLARMQRVSRFGRVLLGALAGMLAPLESPRACGDCTAASSVVSRSDGAAARMVMALGADLLTLLLLAALVGPLFAGAWGALAFLLAILGALFVESNPAPSDLFTASTSDWRERLGRRISDAVAHVILGLLLVAMLAPILDLAELAHWPRWALHVLAFVVALAMPLRGSSAAVLAFALGKHGFPHSALLVFMTGTLVSALCWRGVLPPLLGHHSARRLQMALASAAVIVLGLALSAAQMDLGAAPELPQVIELAMLLLAALFLAAALWSSGPRALLDRVLLVHEGRPHLHAPTLARSDEAGGHTHHHPEHAEHHHHPEPDADDTGSSTY